MKPFLLSPNSKIFLKLNTIMCNSPKNQFQYSKVTEFNNRTLHELMKWQRQLWISEFLSVPNYASLSRKSIRMCVIAGQIKDFIHILCVHISHVDFVMKSVNILGQMSWHNALLHYIVKVIRTMNDLNKQSILNSDQILLLIKGNDYFVRNKGSLSINH